ncbi:MAG: vanadium-dependent haloperoxidase [Woeseiaceae bacterium]
MTKSHRLLLVSFLLAGCGGGGGGSGGNNAPPVISPPTQPPVVTSAVVPRAWNDQVLNAIRNDFARPTVHARNLWHSSAAMYDAWAALSTTADTYLLGKQVAGVDCSFGAFPAPANVTAARQQAISHAVYRIMAHRFASSPGAVDIQASIDAKMQEFGYNIGDTSLDFSNGSAAALGNHIADCYIRLGMVDGANEMNDYANASYSPVNPPIVVRDPGNPDILDLDRWQPIRLNVFIDQAGNETGVDQPEFLSPEWGAVIPFALDDADKTTYSRDGFDYYVFHDPGPPPSYTGSSADAYKWGFSLVATWSSHLDPSDGVMIDISPASIGNNSAYPESLANYDQFYDYLDGGDASQGYASNPVTGQPYAPQIVPRGDYARVLAEFWADGPESETPPGHWFVILNEVADHPDLEFRIGGIGAEVDPQEWYAKAYFALGGAMHDSAIAAWGIKGWYDYIRPLSAFRAMADLGQSSDPQAASYHPDGIPLVPGFIELVEAGDPLTMGTGINNVGKIKVRAWRGPREVQNPIVDTAGVDWILAELWWPYQRPSFVTPPFAGYVSGHSTYSRAAAEVLTALTGSEYFPGGMSGFEIQANEFLVFEDGPTVDMTLQWATYRDASDQCSLSRIWGGIHPPVDDIPGRVIGEQIGIDAYARAMQFFVGTP